MEGDCASQAVETKDLDTSPTELAVKGLEYEVFDVYLLNYAHVIILEKDPANCLG